MKTQGREEARRIARLGSAIALMSALLLSCLYIIPQASAGPTYVHGEITDTHWTFDESPIVIIENAYLDVGKTLVIDPGVEVRIESNRSLVIEGHLHADGSEGEAIVFTSNETVKHPGDWASIFLTEHENIIRNARIEYGHRALLMANQASVVLEQVHFRDNHYAAIYSANASLEMIDSSVMESGEWGIHLRNSEAIIDSSTFSLNGISIRTIGSQMTVVNSTVESPFLDVVLEDDSHVSFINSPVEWSKVAIEDDLSNLTVQWFVTAEVFDEFGSPVPGAEVTFSSELGENTTFVTNEFGLVERAIITEAVLTRLETITHNPYWIIASKEGHEAEALRWIESNAWVELGFAVDLTPPGADAGGNRDVDEDVVLLLDASGSTDNDPNLYEHGSFVWEFDNQGTSVRWEGITVDYVFWTPGRYTITLRVTDPEGNEDVDHINVFVQDTTPPVADAGGFREASVGESVLLDAGNCSDNDPKFWDTASFVWVIELGDASVELPGQMVTYAFETAGNYTVTLHVEDDDGNVDSDEIHVAVKAPAQEFPIIIPLGLGLLAAAFVGGFLNTEVGKFGLFKFLLIPLYVKLKRKDILDHFLRGQIYGYIKVHPGEHYTAIKRNLQLNNGTLTYHLDVLEREGLIVSKPKGSRKIFYPVGMKIPDNGLHAIQEDILERVNESPGMSISDLARLMGTSRQLANYHVKKLVEDGKIDIERKGVRARCFPSEGHPPRSAF